MAAIDWIGTGGDWNIASNWDTDSVPDSDSAVTIDETAPPAGAPVIYGFAAEAYSVMIGAGQTNVAVGFGGSLTVAAWVTVDSVEGMSVGSGTTDSLVSVGSRLTLNGEFAAYTLGTLTAPTIDVNATGEIAIDGGTINTNTLKNVALKVSGNTVGNARGVYLDDQAFPTSGILIVNNTFTNAGTFVVGSLGGANTATIGTLDNQAAGQINIGTGTVTVTTLTNAGVTSGTTIAGIGVDHDAGETGGNLNVTGTFSNTGDFAVGNGAATPTATIATLDNALAAKVIIASGAVKVGALTNLGDSSNPKATAGDILVQPSGSVAANLDISGVFTNTSALFVGDSTMTAAATVTVGTLKGNGAIILAGGKSQRATLALLSTPTTWTTSAGLSGDALLEMKDNGQIGRIAYNGDIEIDGSEAFVADADDTTASSALEQLNHVDGSLQLNQGAAVTVDGNLTVTGVFADVALDILANSGGSRLTVKGTLNDYSHVQVGLSGGAGSTSVALGGLVVSAGGLFNVQDAAATVDGNVANYADGASTLYSDKAALDIDYDSGADGGALTVTGVFTNHGVLNIGSGASKKTTATINTLANLSGALLDIASGAVTIATLTNAASISVGPLNGAPSMVIGVLDNQSNGYFDLSSGDVTVGALTNEADPTKGHGFRGIFVDATFSSSFATILTVTGTFTNEGLLDVTSGTKRIAKVIVGKLDNAGGTIEISQSGFVDVDSSSTTWNGALSIDASYMAYLDGGKVETIAKGGSIKLIGDVAGIYDAGTQSGAITNALSALATIDGSLELDDGANLKVDGDLDNNGVGSGGIEVDYNGGGGSYIDVAGKLTNNGSAYIGYSSATAYSYLRVGALDNKATGTLGVYGAGVVVYGDLTNSSKGAGIYVYGSAALWGELMIKGVATNSGTMTIGYSGADAYNADVDADAFTNSGLVDIDASSPSAMGTLDVTGTYTEQSGAPGLTNVQGTLTATSIVIKGGTIDGDGMIVGEVSNIGGDLQAGKTLASPGKLSIGGPSLPGSYTQGKGGTLTEVIAGASQFGEIAVSGALALAGALRVDPASGFKFKLGESFKIMTFAAGKLKGTFGSIVDGSAKSSGGQLAIGGGLALEIDYNDKGGEIELEVVAAAKAAKVAQAFVYDQRMEPAAGAFSAASRDTATGAPSMDAFAHPIPNLAGDALFDGGR